MYVIYLCLHSWLCQRPRFCVDGVWHARWCTRRQWYTCLHAYIRWTAPHDILQHDKQDVDAVSVDIVHHTDDHLTCLARFLLHSAVTLHICQTATFGNHFCWL